MPDDLEVGGRLAVDPIPDHGVDQPGPRRLRMSATCRIISMADADARSTTRSDIRRVGGRVHRRVSGLAVDLPVLQRYAQQARASAPRARCWRGRRRSRSGLLRSSRRDTPCTSSSTYGDPRGSPPSGEGQLMAVRGIGIIATVGIVVLGASSASGDGDAGRRGGGAHRSREGDDGRAGLDRHRGAVSRRRCWCRAWCSSPVRAAAGTPIPGPEYSVITGGAVALADGARDCAVVSYAAGQAVFIPAGVPHRVANDGAGRRQRGRQLHDSRGRAGARGLTGRLR